MYLSHYKEMATHFNKEKVFIFKFTIAIVSHQKQVRVDRVSNLEAANN